MQSALTNPLLWLAGSLALAVIATNGAWLILRSARHGREPALRRAWEPGKPMIWLLVALFLLLPPFASLWAGALSPYWMGLTETDWVKSLASGTAAAAVGGGLIVLGWLVYRHQLPRRPRSGGPVRQWLAPIDTALLQWHWAFYRAAAIGGLTLLLKTNEGAPGPLSRLPAQLAADPLYWGAWLGMILVAVEWALNPFARRVLAGPRDDPESAADAERTVIRMGLAVVTTAVFVLTRNFWLCLACHVVVETAITAFLPVPAVSEAAP
jgi:hypothetical protein